MKIRDKISQLLLATLIVCASLASCTKTEYTDYETPVQNKITEFLITNSSETLMGAINNDKNTITVYIPYYLGVDYLQPAIKLDAGAILIDDKGEEINLDGGIDVVSVGDTTYYRVQSADNKVRKYVMIQKYVPHSEQLKAGFTVSMEDTDVVEYPVTGVFNVYGNFKSTSKSATFTLTDKSTGKQYANFVKVNSVTPSEDYYTMNVEVVHEALAGEYTVEMSHQGRTAILPDISLKYIPASQTFFSTSSNYAIGDTISFTPSYGMYGNGGIYLDVEKVYIKILEGALVPSGFTTDMYNKEIECEIVSQTRREVKVLVPDMPVGLYANTDRYNFNFFFNYAEATGLGKDVRTGVPSGSFQINAKK